MKFSGSIKINKSREMVVDLFSDPKLIGEYQDGFVKKELKLGVMGENGAISKMYYQNGKHKMELTETIIVNNLPESFEAVYEHKHMDNTLKCTFTCIDENTTRYTTEVHYTRINWVMPRLMAILFPGLYRKPAIKWLNNFKVFAENQSESNEHVGRKFENI